MKKAIGVVSASKVCGIFVRNSKVVQLIWRTGKFCEGSEITAGKTFKTFGAAVTYASKKGFTRFESDDAIYVPITEQLLKASNR